MLSTLPPYSSSVRRLAAAAALAVAISACSGGAPAGSKDSASKKDGVPPVFKGAVLSYSGSKGSLSLHWPAATDNATPADKLSYKVYVGTSADPGAIAQNANLKATVTNKTTATVYELTPGASYYCLVKAVDEAGNQSLNTGVSTVTAQSADLIASATPKVLEKMNVSVSQSAADSAVIGGAEAASIAAGDILVMNNPYGQSLKKVVTAKKTGGNIAVTLKDAGLGEVVRSGNIGSSSLMASASGLPVQKIGGEIPGTFNMQYKDPAGFFEITDYGVSDDPGAKAAKDMAKYNEIATLAPGITLGYSILFEPELVTSSQFDPGKFSNTLTSIRVSAKGTLSFDAKTLYELKQAGSHDVTKRVVNRGISMKYAIGAVPVEQETNLEVMAHLQLNAATPLNMYAELSTSKTVEIAFEWTRETGWRQVANDTFDQRITLNIMSEGKIAGTLELFPIISTRFFKAVKTGSYKIPKLNVNADVRIIPPPLEVSVFDASVHVDSYIAASPKVFGFTVAEWEKNQREIQNQKLTPAPVVVAEAGKKGTDVPLDLKTAGTGKAGKPPVVEAKAPATPAAKPATAPVVEAKAPAAPATKPTPAPVVEAKAPAAPAAKPTPAPVVKAKAPAAPAAKPAPTPVVEAKAPVAPTQKTVETGSSGMATVSFDDLAPGVVSTSRIPTVATLTVTGANLKDVDKITFSLVRVKSGAKAGTYIWTKLGKQLRRPWNAKVIVNADGTLTLKPFVIGRGATTRQTTWTVALTDKSGTSTSKTFLVDFTSPTGTVVAKKQLKESAPVEKAQAHVTPPPMPAPVKAAPPVEKAQAPVTPPPAPKPVKVAPPVEKAQAPVTPPPAPKPVKIAPPVEKAEAPVTPPPAPKPAPVPAPVKAAPPVEKAEAPVTPPPAPKPVKVAPPVEKAQAHVTPPPMPAPVKAAPPVEKAQAPVTPPPAPKPVKVAPPVEKAEAPVTPPPAPKPVKVAPPVKKAETPVTPPPAPKPAAVPAPVKAAPPVEKAQAPVTPPPAPKPAPAPAPVKVAPPVEKAQAPVMPPPAPKPAPAPAPIKAAPPVEKAQAKAPAAAKSDVSSSGTVGAAVIGLMGGSIQRPLAVTGAVSTFAGTAGAIGTADGPTATARFNYLHGITADGTNLYVTDQSSGTIRKVVIATGAVTTLAGSAGVPGSTDGTGTAAKFYLPEGITTDGTNLFVADRNNNTVRKIVIATGAVTTLAGNPGVPGSTDGTGTAARFAEPTGITTDGKNLYVSDKKNSTIRKVVIATGAVTTLAGKTGVPGSTDGTGTAAQFTSPAGITTDGQNLYVADQYSYTIRKIVIATGAVSTLAGKGGVSGTTDGKGTAALFNGPAGITTDGQNLYVTEPLKNTVRKIVIATGVVTTLSSGEGTAALFKTPKGITSDGTHLYVADYGNQTVKKIK